MAAAAEAGQSRDRYNAYQWNRNQIGAQADTGDWFEWWYYKAVVPGTDRAYYFLYGIVNPWDTGATRSVSRAYTGFGNFGDRRILTQEFPVADFRASYDTTLVQVGGNVATDRRIQGDITDSVTGARASWDITVTPEWTFDAMGWSMGVPGISNIYWYPAQASARMNGWVSENGVTTRLVNAPAYQDRNWGRSFPQWWTWIVSNHFADSPGTTLAVGGGRPKFLERYSVHDGLTIGFRHAGQDYEFRTPDGDSIRLDVKFGTWEVTGTNSRGQKIEISAFAPREKFLDLQFKTPAGEIFHDYEALKGSVRVRVYERSATAAGAWKLVADLSSEEAGIEYGSFDSSALSTFFRGTIGLR